jgi:hypothetical protein
MLATDLVYRNLIFYQLGSQRIGYYLLQLRYRGFT